MRYMPAKPSPLPTPEAQILVELGERLRKARLRRQLTAEVVAGGAGITRVTVHRAERGEPAVTIGTIIKIMGVLGLATDVALLARDDKLGRLMQDDQLPRRRSATRASLGVPRSGRVRIDRYPQLKQIAWHLAPSTTELDEADAFAIYERNWRHVDRDALTAREKALIATLTATVGKGVFLV